MTSFRARFLFTVPVATEKAVSKLTSPLSEQYALQQNKNEPSGFICGDCGAANTMTVRDAIRCRECGYRIMYKMRKQRPIEFYAR